MGPTDPARMSQMITFSPLYPRYAQEINRDSAQEMLARKLEAGARAAEQQAAQSVPPTTGYATPTQPRAERSESTRASSRRSSREKSVLEQVASSSVAKQFARSAGREIVRALFGTARRR